MMDSKALKDALALAAAKFQQAEGRLNALDGAIGDGDHGITMRIGFDAVRTAVGAMDDNAPPDMILRTAGMAFMGATGGAIGVILGKALRAGGLALRGTQQVGPAEFLCMLKSMDERRGDRRQGEARRQDDSGFHSRRSGSGAGRTCGNHARCLPGGGKGRRGDCRVAL